MVYQHADWERVPETAASDQSELYIPENKPVKFEFNEPILINQSGYIYIWLSNESKDTRVWFDDLTVTHTQNLVVQASDYGVWGDVLREQKSDERKYRFGYQGQFAEKDEETGWNHFELREYDPVIGRWLVPDPMRQYASRYIAFGNNPVNRVDPNGGEDREPGLFTRLFNGFKNWFNNLLAPGSSEFNEDIDFKSNNDKSQRVVEVAHDINMANYLSKVEVTPYASISLGKESGEGSILSGNSTIMITYHGIYITPGADITIGDGSLFNTSASFSAGVIIGPKSQIEGYSLSGTAGLYHLGFQGGRSFNDDGGLFPLPSGWGDSYQIGGVVSTSRFWASVNGGYTFRVYSFED